MCASQLKLWKKSAQEAEEIIEGPTAISLKSVYQRHISLQQERKGNQSNGWKILKKVRRERESIKCAKLAEDSS